MRTAAAFQFIKRPSVFFLSLFICTATIVKAQPANQALLLNGMDAYADLGVVSPSGNFSSGITIECWAYWNSFNNWSRLLDLGNGSGSDNILFANEGSNPNLRFEVYQNSSTQGLTSPVNMSTGKWYHVAVTQDNTGWTTIYIDGKAVVSGTVQVPLDISRNLCYIGLSNWAGDAYFDGRIEEMRIWNVARTADDIKRYMFKDVAANAPGLISMYHCNEGSGATLVNSCTNGVTGDGIASVSMAWTTSPVQFSYNALAMDGMDDYVYVGTPLAANSSYTKEAWVYLTDNSGLPNNILSSNNSPFWIDGGYLKAGNSGSAAEVTDPNPFPTGTWVHVAVSYNASMGELSLFRNGVLVASNSFVGPFYGDENYIGAWFNGAATESYFTGVIDEVRIWNVPRSETEIQQNMNRELNPAAEADLVAYYTFNQGEANLDNTGLMTVVDQKGNFNGDLFNLDLNGSLSNYIQQQNSLTVLPVNFQSFNVMQQKSSVVLQWATSAEQNLLDFVIQRSTNGRNWTSLSVLQASGNVDGSMNYSYTDLYPVTGKNYYRLQARDRDGKVKYSSIHIVVFNRQAAAFTILNTKITTGMLEIQVNRTTTLSLFASDGRMLWTKILPSGYQAISTGGYAKGVYFLKGNESTEKILIQ